jgi:hypothetical protein
MKTILGSILKVVELQADRILEEKIIKNYLGRFGMDQILATHGVDVNDLKSSLDNMIKNS